MGCRCATSWYDLDMTFDLAVVTFTYKILSRLYLGNNKVCLMVLNSPGCWVRASLMLFYYFQHTEIILFLPTVSKIKES